MVHFLRVKNDDSVRALFGPTNPELHEALEVFQKWLEEPGKRIKIGTAAQKECAIKMAIFLGVKKVYMYKLRATKPDK
jgi:hypothetical protein